MKILDKAAISAQNRECMVTYLLLPDPDLNRPLFAGSMYSECESFVHKTLRRFILTVLPIQPSWEICYDAD